MSKKNRNKLKKQKIQTNHSKKSISESVEPTHHQAHTKNNQIEIIQKAKKIPITPHYSSCVDNEIFNFKPSWMIKKTDSVNCKISEQIKFNENIKCNVKCKNYVFQFKINSNLKLIDLFYKFSNHPNSLPNSSIAKNSYRFDLIIYLFEFFNLVIMNQKKLNSPPKESSKKRQRVGYIIERDCHIFGGCVEDDAQDEFFISSGAVYQSWPYVYEPGYRMTPLIEYVNWPLSKSADSICINEINDEIFDDNSIDQDHLPAYSLQNFEINLINVEKKKKRRKKWNSNGSEDSYYSSADDSFYEDSDSDDSESIIAYKQRHAIGLNSFNHELRNLNMSYRPSNKFGSFYYDETSNYKKIQFLSQKRFDESINDVYLINSCNREYFSSPNKNGFYQGHKYSFSSDNLVF